MSLAMSWYHGFDCLPLTRAADCKRPWLAFFFLWRGNEDDTISFFFPHDYAGFSLKFSRWWRWHNQWSICLWPFSIYSKDASIPFGTSCYQHWTTYGIGTLSVLHVYMIRHLCNLAFLPNLDERREGQAFWIKKTNISLMVPYNVCIFI